MYRIGFLGWKLAARLGVRLMLRVDVLHDSEAQVYVATSPDMAGLVAEAKTPAELLQAVYDCADMLVAEALSRPPKFTPYVAWDGRTALA